MRRDESLDRVVVVPESAEFSEQARRLAARWGLAFMNEAEAPYLLVLGAERLELRKSGPDAPGPVFVDFSSGPLDYRRKRGGGRTQAIARAAGLKKGRNPDVLDATAGLGRDAFILACLGSRVTLVEKSPVLAALITDAMDRASSDHEVASIVRERMRLVHADALTYMRRLADHEKPDVVYLDPMYPKRRKSALVKKEMQILKELVGGNTDCGELLRTALLTARKRVVVKRPLSADRLDGMKPSLVIRGRKHRFDVYLEPALK